MEFMHFAGHHLESPVLTNVLLVVLCGIQLEQPICQTRLKAPRRSAGSARARLDLRRARSR